MKKLLTLLIIGGLLGFTTGCPQGTTSQTKSKMDSKGSTVSTEKQERGGKSGKMDDKKMDDKKMDDKKMDDKKMDDKKSDKKMDDKKTDDKKK